MPSARDGRMSECRECSRARQARYRSENPERARESSRRSYEKHKEKRLAESRSWKAENSDRVKAYKREHPESRSTARKRARLWAQNNQGRYRRNMAEAAGRRRSRKKCAVTKAGKAQIKAVYGIAAWLKSQGDDVHVDHIVPLALGGEHRFSNLRILPALQNRIKSASEPTTEDLREVEILKECAL